MASALDSQTIASRETKQADEFTGSATETLAAGLDMRDYRKYQAFAVVTGITGNGMTLLEIIASASANMGTPTVIKTSGTIAAGTAGDTQPLECEVSEIAQLGATLRYVAPRVTIHNTSDVVWVISTRQDPRQAVGDLTAASIT